MDDIKIEKYEVFNIDVDNDSIEKIDLVKINDNHLLQYILKLANDSKYKDAARKAHFKKSSLVSKNSHEYYTGQKKTDLSDLAKLLLKSESDNNKRISQLNVKIKPGSLIICKIKRSKDNLIVIAKVEFSNYLERKTFILETGLPQENSLVRSCLIEYKNNKPADEISIFGSKGVIPSYWHDGFLWAEFIRNSSKNTEESFKLIESKISSIKKISKNDYIDLRDCLIGYYKGNEIFQFDELVEILTEKFKPESDKVKISDLKKKLEKLKESNKFDGSFEIDKKAVRARAKRTYVLDNDVQVVANAGSKTIFQAEKNEKNYVIIESKSTHDDFKKIELDQLL